MRDDELKVLQDLDTKVFQSVPHKSRIFPIKIIPFSTQQNISTNTRTEDSTDPNRLKVSANKWFLPLVWATDICARALAEGHIRPQVRTRSMKDDQDQNDQD